MTFALEIASQIVKEHEGCRLTAYRDGADIWTIGVGHTGPEVHEGLVWTQEQADRRLDDDLLNAIFAVERNVKIKLSDRQLAALTSFVFNVGESAFAKSTLLTLLNQGAMLEAAEQFPRWSRAGGVKVKGLLRRRFNEASLFLEGS